MVWVEVYLLLVVTMDFILCLMKLMVHHPIFLIFTEQRLPLSTFSKKLSAQRNSLKQNRKLEMVKDFFFFFNLLSVSVLLLLFCVCKLMLYNNMALKCFFLFCNWSQYLLSCFPSIKETSFRNLFKFYSFQSLLCLSFHK